MWNSADYVNKTPYEENAMEYWIDLSENQDRETQ